MGINPTGTDFLGPFRQPLYHLFLDLGRFNDFRVEVGLWHGEFEHIRRLDVRHPFESGHQLRQVIKLGKPCPGTITGAFRRQLNGGDGFPEVPRPVIEMDKAHLL